MDAPLPPEVVEELQHRYAQIGLRDTPNPEAPPLTRWTFTQAYLLEQALAASGNPLRVYAAMRNWHPFIADVVGQIRADGITHLIAICLAPQNSRTSIGLYRRALTAALESGSAAAPIQLTFVEEWPEQPALIEAFAQRLVDCCATLQSAGSTRYRRSNLTPVLFTAHSVPCRTIMTGEASIAGARPGTPIQATPDPYPVEAKRTAASSSPVPPASFLNSSPGSSPSRAKALPVARGSAPPSKTPSKAIRDEGHAGVILQPVGFLCDHVEILYDIDIAFTEAARNLGLRLYRPESLNDSPLLTEALLSVVCAALNRQPSVDEPRLT